MKRSSNIGRVSPAWRLLRDADPGNNDLKHFTSLTLRWIGDVLKSQGKLSDALTAYREALALAEGRCQG